MTCLDVFRSARRFGRAAAAVALSLLTCLGRSVMECGRTGLSPPAILDVWAPAAVSATPASSTARTPGSLLAGGSASSAKELQLLFAGLDCPGVVRPGDVTGLQGCCRGRSRLLVTVCHAFGSTGAAVAMVLPFVASRSPGSLCVLLGAAVDGSGSSGQHAVPAGGPGGCGSC